MSGASQSMHTGKVFDIQRWSLHDGPGIRTVVFLKGCPLRCAWCSNPESQEFHNELVFFKDKCIACFRCIENCPYGAVTVKDSYPFFDRTICGKECYSKGLDEFPCTKECYSQAIRPIARVMSVQEVMKEVMKDELIYQQSKVGGLTISGGEPLSQPHFAKQLFISAKEAGITTAIESTGYAKWEVIKEVIPYIDYFFLDLKAYDDDLHKRLVGVSNGLIFSNATKISRLLAEMDKPLTVRIPVVPQNTQFEDFKKLLRFIKDELDSSVEVEIMAYHRLGRNKYGDLGKSYELFDLEPFSKEELKPYHDAVHSFGFSFS